VSTCALLLALAFCALTLLAQEAPRTQSLSPIKPPMIKPPMQNTRNANTGAGARQRRRATRRRRGAKSSAKTRRRTAARPRAVEAVGEAPPGTGDASIKPPMANRNNAALATPSKPISAGVLNGKAITLPKPAYPAIARSARVTGTVVVEVVIDERGDVMEAHAVSGHAMLRPAAVEAAREAKFTPTLLAGQPVKVTGTITYDFVP
jgi:protein TonB